MNDPLKNLMFEELNHFCGSGGIGGFLPGMKQIANVAALPGIVGVSFNVFLSLVFLFYYFFKMNRDLLDCQMFIQVTVLPLVTLLHLI